MESRPWPNQMAAAGTENGLAQVQVQWALIDRKSALAMVLAQAVPTG